MSKKVIRKSKETILTTIKTFIEIETNGEKELVELFGFSSTSGVFKVAASVPSLHYPVILFETTKVTDAIAVHGFLSSLPGHVFKTVMSCHTMHPGNITVN